MEEGNLQTRQPTFSSQKAHSRPKKNNKPFRHSPNTSNSMNADVSSNYIINYIL